MKRLLFCLLTGACLLALPVLPGCQCAAHSETAPETETRKPPPNEFRDAMEDVKKHGPPGGYGSNMPN